MEQASRTHQSFLQRSHILLILIRGLEGGSVLLATYAVGSYILTSFLALLLRVHPGTPFSQAITGNLAQSRVDHCCSLDKDNEQGSDNIHYVDVVHT